MVRFPFDRIGHGSHVHYSIGRLESLAIANYQLLRFRGRYDHEKREEVL